ncbi:hypothetical protein VHUM_02290 [Vanrija humicola]|uniref:Bromo domain-containing protein n=1 Tax=Vanrija humicola TaxID=5417 RepID=A0A7D8V2B6_VANHU|nr:hypothetical protein VHUM_02290 [Vanrija humicola]
MPPIKLKLSLGGLTPSATASPATPATPIIKIKGKGKNKSANASAAPSPSPAATSPAATPAATPLAMTPVTPAPTTPAPERIPKKRGRPPKIRPTAIPPHVVTPQEFFNIKAEPVDSDDADPLSLPLSPAAGSVTPLNEGTSTPGGWEGDSEFTTYNPRVVKWKRVKRPFKELANKALHEMRRKDVYGFFLEPVNLDDYPDYLEVVGGEDKMMDLQTMQTKVDENEYRSMDELEADFKTMIDAALKFNLPGTAPYREANKVQVHGQKHIDRAKPLVLTPSPSPEPEPQQSEVGTPAPVYLGKPQKDVPPKNLIPDAMLAFPPNSLQAKAIGWNLTGGRIVRPKRMVRGREKFFGKWREYGNDGSLSLAEMDDPQEHLDIFRLRRGDEWRTVTDWPAMLDNNQGKAWWDWEGLGGATGQPPLPNTERLKPEPLKTRELGTFDFGVYPEIERDIKSLQDAKDSQAYDPEDDDLDVLADQLRSDAPPPVTVPPHWPAQSFVNAYDRPSATHWLYNMSLGGVRGEAYNNSVQKFLDGAISSAKANGSKTTDDTASILQEYVANKWRGGVLHSDTTRLASDTDAILQNAHDAYSRIALRSLTSAANPLDIQPLLREPSDFLYLGVGGKAGVNDAVSWVGGEINRVSGVRDEARKAAGVSKADTDADVVMADGAESAPANGDAARTGIKRRNSDSEPVDAEAKRRKVDAPEAATNGSAPKPPADETENGLRQLRLELVALSKFYPLASLKKMSKEDAERLLPPNVRNLMTQPQ